MSTDEERIDRAARIFEVYPPRWEYMVTEMFVSKYDDHRLRDMEILLNESGQEGWELVGVEPAPRTRDITEYGKRTLMAFFKRPWRGYT